MNAIFKWIDEISMLLPIKLLKGVRIAVLLFWIVIGAFASYTAWQKGNQKTIYSFSHKMNIPLLEERALQEKNLREQSKSNVILPDLSETNIDVTKREDSFLENDMNHVSDFFYTESETIGGGNRNPSLIGESNHLASERDGVSSDSSLSKIDRHEGTSDIPLPLSVEGVDTKKDFVHSIENKTENHSVAPSKNYNNDDEIPPLEIPSTEK